MNLLCTDVGHVPPIGFTRPRRHPQLEVGTKKERGPTAMGGPPVGEVDRVLRRVEKKLTALME
jgi:hypothetical protein